MRLLITGATGFIGAHLVTAAAALKIEVVALTRTGICPIGAVKAFKWSFGQPIPMGSSANVDCAIHLAHDFGGEIGGDLTIKSTLALTSQLEADGVRRQLFFSSYSAGEYASSIYGRVKFTLEQLLATNAGVIIVRPGLVLGRGGIYGRICKWAQVLPFLPLPDGGTGKVPVIEICKLSELILELVSEPTPPPEANLFECELKTLRELVLSAAAEVGRRPFIVRIPSSLMIAMLELSERLHIPLPVNTDNLIGFIANQSATHKSTLKPINEHENT